MFGAVIVGCGCRLWGDLADFVEGDEVVEKLVGNCKKVIKNQKRLWYNGVIEEVLYIISGVKYNEKYNIKHGN